MRNGWLWLAALLLGPLAAGAQSLPAEIRIIVPVTAGSTLDTRARMMAEALGQRLKRPVIVENRTGAGGTIATLAVARSKPDGSTLLFTNNSHAISPHIYPNAGYDPIGDFAPVAQAYVSGMILVAHPDLKVDSLAGLAALARKQAAPLSYASSGTGGLPHLAMELFKEVAGIDLVHIPYRGDAQALGDVLGGRVPLMVSGYIAVMPHIKSGKLRALAVTGRQRAAIFPNVPTIAEAGFPAFLLETWAGFLAPAGTPEPVVATLNRELAAALATPAMREQFVITGAEAAVTTPAEFALFIRHEWTAYGKLVAKLQLKPE
jgi:tripartite-type tricarboxylate transporter receptor subunit TctC